MSETTTEAETRSTVDTSSLKWISGIISLIGLWVFVSPFIFESTPITWWNNVVVGLAIFLLAGYNYYRMSKTLLASVGVSALVALLGLWIIIAPFVIDVASGAMAWSTLISGLLVAVLSGYNAYANRRADTAATGTQA